MNSQLIPWSRGPLARLLRQRLAGSRGQARPGSTPSNSMFSETRNQKAGGPRQTEMPLEITQSDCDHFYLTDGETEALARPGSKEPAVFQILE